MMYRGILPGIMAGLLFLSCESKTQKADETVELGTNSEELMGVPALEFSLLPQNLSLPETTLEMYFPLGNQKFKPGKIPFEFNIKNLPMTDGRKGLELRMVLNGNDPKAYAGTLFQEELKEGTYRAVAYLVGPDGIALKDFGNYVERDFMVGNTRAFPYQAEPYIVLNSPVQQQVFDEGESPIIDFLLLGGDLKADQLKVQVEVDGEIFETQDLLPIKVSYLSKGTHALKVKLLKKDGKELDGPFSSVSKTVIVK